MVHLQESLLLEDDAALQFLYNQVVADVANNRIDVEGKSSQLRMLKAQKKEREVGTDALSPPAFIFLPPCFSSLSLSLFPDIFSVPAQFVELSQTLPGYSTIQFPHCKCDAKKSGHIIMTVSANGLKLKACTEDGQPEVRLRESERVEEGKRRRGG